MSAPTAATAASWRQQIAVDAAAELIPGLSVEEFAALRDDIAANGIRVPVIFLREAVPAGDLDKLSALRLLDGRHRLDAAEGASVDIIVDGKIAVPHEIVEAGSVDAIALVGSLNLHRRHLTAEKKAELVTALKAAAPAMSIRAIAEQTGLPKSTVAEALARAPVRNRTPVRGRDGKTYKRPPLRLVGKDEATQKPPSSCPKRDQLIVDLVGLLRRDFGKTFVDLLAILGDERERIAALSEIRRIEIARRMLAVLDVQPGQLSG